MTPTITLVAGGLPAVVEAARGVAADQGGPGEPSVDVVRAPGEARTTTTNVRAAGELVVSARVVVARVRRGRWTPLAFCRVVDSAGFDQTSWCPTR